MTRIVAGRARGRRLAVPTRPGLRPTADRTREALFSTLAGLLDLAGTRVLDLYAGSGAVGLEALSRGAAEAVLVESDAAAARVIAANIAAVGLPGARVVRADVARFLSRPPANLDADADAADAGGTGFDLVFADPPYRVLDPTVAGALACVAASWTRPNAVVVVERPTRAGPWAWPPGLVAIKDRAYGEGTLWYGRRP